MHLMTFHPAPRKMASSSWMIFPLPRTGPSRRCRLQLTTKIRLSSFSREASVMEPRDSGSSISPSPRKAQTLPPVDCLESAILEVLDEARVVDRLNRAEAHRDGGELPELGHEPGMRIGTQTAAGLQFAAEILQLLFGDAAFEIGAGVNSGRRVALEIDDVAVAAFGLRAEEMIERDFVRSSSPRRPGTFPASARTPARTPRTAGRAAALRPARAGRRSPRARRCACRPAAPA